MTDTREVIKVFLASPGDLEEERKLVREAVKEVNELWAAKWGFQIELYGWEETIAGYGRPQELINAELEECDLFIGMMWRRWGTPPNTEGEFTSGFEEEYTLAVRRREATGRPEISIFFKEVHEDLLRDPGDGLKRVVDFKNEVIQQKKILFNEFRDPPQIGRLARKCVTRFIDDLRERREGDRQDIDKPEKGAAGKQREEAHESKIKSPVLSDKATVFLKDIVAKMEFAQQEEDLDQFSIARFRLIANSISQTGNHEQFLGAHDANLLYQSTFNGWSFGEVEVRGLMGFGLKGLTQENIPFWAWFDQLRKLDAEGPLIELSVFGSTDDEINGAISVLRMLRVPLPSKDAPLDSDFLKEAWFSKKRAPRLRVSALKYLASVGSEAEIETAEKELQRSESSTSNAALECIVQLLLKSCKPKEACSRLLNANFVSLDDSLISEPLKELDQFSEGDLLVACKHPSPQIRSATLKELSSRPGFDVSTAKEFLRDPEIEIRLQALILLLMLGVEIGENRAKELLEENNDRFLGGNFGLRSSSSKSSSLFAWEKYKLQRLKVLDDDQLKARVDNATVYDLAPYFEAIRRGLPKSLAKIRANVDDQFKAFFDTELLKMKETLGGGSGVNQLLEQVKELEDHIRKEATRFALSILAENCAANDLSRIRKNLKDGYCGASVEDFSFLRKHGAWTDIMLIAGARPAYLIADRSWELTVDEFREVAAEAIIVLSGKKSVSDLVRLPVKPETLGHIVRKLPFSRFEQLSDADFLHLCNHENADVRKYSAIKAVRCFSFVRINALLRKYVLSDDYRYYNVIHWLDLGCSLKRKEAKAVADYVLSKS